MIAIQTENAFGVTGVTSRAATSPLSGRVHVAVTPLRARAEVCPQAARSFEQVSVVAASAAAPMGLGIDARGDWALLADGFAPDAIAPTTHLGVDKQYGNTPHHSGTRALKPPV
jgi:hypothetical protein